MSRMEDRGFLSLKLGSGVSEASRNKVQPTLEGKGLYKGLGRYQEVKLVGGHFRNCLPHLLTTFSDLISLMKQQA